DRMTEIHPRRLEDYLQFFRGIKDTRCAGIHIVHLGCVSDSDLSDTAAHERDGDFGFFSLMQIAQAIGELNIAAPVKMAVLSSGLHQVIGDEKLDPSMAAALGPCGVIPREFPNITCFSIDFARSWEPGGLNENHRAWIL